MAKPTEAEWKAHEDYVLDLKLMRDHLRSTDVENQLSKDRLILTIGGGALVLTSTLLTDVFKDPAWLWVLFLSWGLLLLSLTFVAVSYQTVHRSNNARIENISTYIEANDPHADLEEDDDDAWTDRLNFWSLPFLIAGLFGIALFVGVNYYSMEV